MEVADDRVPSVAKISADCNGPELVSPPSIRMRPSGSRTVAAFARACDRVDHEVQAPIKLCGKLAFSVPAKVKRAAREQMTHRYRETNFMKGLVSFT